MLRYLPASLVLGLVFAPLPALAVDHGDVSATDARVRFYTYSTEEVYALTGYFGHVTTIFFRDDEEIQTISAGDSQAWDVTVAKNKDFLFIKPVLEPARRSNLTIVTNRRTYVFDLRMGAIEDGAETLPIDLTYKVRFHYAAPPVAQLQEPDEDALAEERRLAQEERARWEEEQAAEEARREQEKAEAEQRRLEAQARADAERQKMLERLRAPSVIFDETEKDEEPVDNQPRDFPDEYRERIISGRSDDQVFLDDAATRKFEGAVAYKIDDPGTKILQGALIHGVLETALDSTFTGMLRATVAQNMFSADASRVLIPRGSRLIGQYRSNVQFGTTRVLVAWNRLIRPDGASIELGAPGTDALGRAGMGGFADSHWATRFGAAALISVFQGGSVHALAQLDEDIGRDSAEDISSTANENFSRLLEPYVDIPTTIHVDQGARIIIFVARDLDFSPVEEKPGANMLVLR